MKLKNIFRLDWLIVIVIAFGTGFFIKGLLLETKPETAAPETTNTSTDKVQWWTCSMHPEIRQPKPGKCPKCFMELIPVSTEDSHAGPRQIAFSPEAIKLMDIETATVERKFAEAEIRMTGKIDYDETRLQDVTAWVAGRIDRMYVDFTGTQVIKGDHMFDLYSPDLISAQAEFLEANKSAENLTAESSDLVQRSVRSTLEAAREKLRLLGLSDSQIQNIRQTNQASDHITINAPRDAIVIKKHLAEGAYVKTGTPVYTIADLSHLWVQLDAYESDMPWVRFGQDVEFTTEAYPGEIFHGRVTFIAPTLDAATRTIKLRVNVDNHNLALKPGMFVRAVIRSRIASNGPVADSEMAGKWMCPMHPSVVKDDPGPCDICGMDLVTVASLGYIAADANQPPLVIPATAPLITGKRSVVYVQVPDTEKPIFEGRQVVLGPRAGDYYLVEEGLTEGEQVVVNGNFKIDSALQIQAKPSMMSPADSMTEIQKAKSDEQTLCPVMGNPIDKTVFTEYKGKKVYFCCPGCIETFEKNPEKYINKLPQFRN